SSSRLQWRATSRRSGPNWPDLQNIEWDHDTGIFSLAFSHVAALAGFHCNCVTGEIAVSLPSSFRHHDVPLPWKTFVSESMALRVQGLTAHGRKKRH
ncbi:hypothetical protein BGZ49_003906, partial [Haplosporangium sp. Z 27]